MFVKKQTASIAKEIISIQILWTVFAVLLYAVVTILRDRYSLSSKFSLSVTLLWILANFFVILRNAA